MWEAWWWIFQPIIYFLILVLSSWWKEKGESRGNVSWSMKAEIFRKKVKCQNKMLKYFYTEVRVRSALSPILLHGKDELLSHGKKKGKMKKTNKLVGYDKNSFNGWRRGRRLEKNKAKQNMWMQSLTTSHGKTDVQLVPSQKMTNISTSPIFPFQCWTWHYIESSISLVRLSHLPWCCANTV